MDNDRSEWMPEDDEVDIVEDQQEEEEESPIGNRGSGGGHEMGYFGGYAQTPTIPGVPAGSVYCGSFDYDPSRCYFYPSASTNEPMPCPAPIQRSGSQNGERSRSGAEHEYTPRDRNTPTIPSSSRSSGGSRNRTASSQSRPGTPYGRSPHQPKAPKSPSNQRSTRSSREHRQHRSSDPGEMYKLSCRHCDHKCRLTDFHLHAYQHFLKKHKMAKPVRIKCKKCGMAFIDFLTYVDHYRWVPVHRADREPNFREFEMFLETQPELTLQLKRFIDEAFVPCTANGELLGARIPGYGQPVVYDNDGTMGSTPSYAPPVTPSYPGSGHATPNYSGTGRATPNYSGSGHATPNYSGAGRVTPNATPNYEDRPAPNGYERPRASTIGTAHYKPQSTPSRVPDRERSSEEGPSRTPEYSSNGYRNRRPSNNNGAAGGQTPSGAKTPRAEEEGQSTRNHRSSRDGSRTPNPADGSSTPNGTPSTSRGHWDTPQEHLNHYSQRGEGVKYSRQLNDWRNSGSRSPGFETDADTFRQIEEQRETVQVQSRSTAKAMPSRNRQSGLLEPTNPPPPRGMSSRDKRRERSMIAEEAQKREAEEARRRQQREEEEAQRRLIEEQQRQKQKEEEESRKREAEEARRRQLEQEMLRAQSKNPSPPQPVPPPQSVPQSRPFFNSFNIRPQYPNRQNVQYPSQNYQNYHFAQPPNMQNAQPGFFNNPPPPNFQQFQQYHQQQQQYQRQNQQQYGAPPMSQGPPPPPPPPSEASYPQQSHRPMTQPIPTADPSNRLSDHHIDIKPNVAELRAKMAAAKPKEVLTQENQEWYAETRKKMSEETIRKIQRGGKRTNVAPDPSQATTSRSASTSSESGEPAKKRNRSDEDEPGPSRRSGTSNQSNGRGRGRGAVRGRGAIRGGGAARGRGASGKKTPNRDRSYSCSDESE